MTEPSSGDSGRAPGRGLGGIVHTYQKYDPKNFPPPTSEPPDLASLAMEHMLRFGNTRGLTPEELARAVKLDPSQIAGMGPPLNALIAMLEERKRKILETYEVESARAQSERDVASAARDARPPAKQRSAFDKAVRDQSIPDLERLYDAQRDDTSPFAQELMRVIGAAATRYQVDELAAKYAFTGREELSPADALAIKEELESIDRLLEQLKQAMKDAQIGIIDMEELAEFAEQEQIEALKQLQQQIEDYIRQEAERQGLEQGRQGFQLTPQAMRLFQGKVLQEIFSSLQAARSGRHAGPILGDGPIELPKTKPYEFGDSLAGMDAPASFVNAMVRRASEAGGRERAGPSVRGDAGEGPDAPDSPYLLPEDIEIHRTRNTPKCATVVLLDMSGSMRYDGQYVNAKRMALALDGLIRREYPGDFLAFVECYTFAKRRHISEIPALLPKPVTIHQPVVRLRADMSKPDMSEMTIPGHFTNLQQGIRLARQLLSGQETPNRQILLITDGLPTAHFEDEQLYMLYPPDPRTEEATMREASAAAKEGAVINFFLLPNWWQSSEDVAFAHQIAERTKGRVFFAGGKELERFVLWDYVSNRRRVLGA